MQLQTLSVCAWCGSKNPLAVRLIKTREEKLTGYYVVAHTSLVREYEFQLPICQECDARLRRSQLLIVLSSLGSALAGFIVAPLLLFLVGIINIVCVMVAFLSAITGAILGALVGHALFKQKAWGRVKNGQLEFYNEKVQQAFNVLAQASPLKDTTMQTGSHTLSL